MYRELEAKIAYRGISKKQMAEEIHMNYNTLLAKIGGKSKFTLDEAVTIKDSFLLKKLLYCYILCQIVLDRNRFIQSKFRFSPYLGK